MKFVVILFLIFIFSTIGHARCGTAQIFNQKKSTPSKFARTLLNCAPEEFYDSVYTKETEHFQIFFTLTGPHQTSKIFVDSIAENLEKSWDFYINKMKFKKPQGFSQTHHYQKEVKTNLYPVEVIEIDLLRNANSILGSSGCHGCYGLTLPNEDNPKMSQLFFDNDFRFIPEYNVEYETFSKDSSSCEFPKSTESLKNSAHHFDYSTFWDKAIQITAAHEFYHSIQLQYLNMYKYWTFWFEASAAGMEEILAPEVDDYFSYLPSFVRQQGVSFESLYEDYGAGIFLLYLYNHFDIQSERKIWEYFEKNPSKNFANALEHVALEKELSADSLFHDFAIRLAFSGSQSALVSQSFLIHNDQEKWPNYTYKKNLNIQPQLEPLAFEYYWSKNFSPQNFIGQISAINTHSNPIKIFHLKTPASFDSLLYNNDSLLYIFSHLNSTDTISEIPRDSTLKAYPTPWRKGDLCFSLLPLDKSFIEIRNRRGDLVFREKYENTTHCMDETKIKAKMAPGIYRYRVGSHGKLKNLMIIY